MRLRKKPGARPALEECSFFVNNPEMNMGSWQQVFKNTREINLELGCGKGAFISKLASSELNKNFIAVDIKDEVLVIAKEKIESAYSSINNNFENIRITSYDILLISKILSENDLVKRIYINFCNPWYMNHMRKKRLTYPRQLYQYKSFLADGGQIWFKTDDDQLFHNSKIYFKECEFKIVYLTEDLHQSGFEENIETEHEKMYSEQGIKIKFLIAQKYG